MENKQKIKIYIGLLLTIILIMGVSYAYFRIYKSQTNDNVIGTRTCLDTTLTENSSEIILTDAFPISDERGLTKDPYTFTLTNNCDSYVEYEIALFSNYRDSTDTQYLKDDYVKINLSPKGLTKSSSDILSTLPLGDIDTTRKGYILEETGLRGNETKSYDLRLWLDSETTAEQGLNKTWKGKVVVTITAAKETQTLLSKILGENNVNVSEPQTIPGSEISSSTEAVLASTEDDYGTSYYFRGAVENNYVEYANMCWRIVRSTGDGSIKMVLSNNNGLTELKNTPKSNTPCNATGDELAHANINDNDTCSEFNRTRDDNAFIGLMYGDVDASSYMDTHANTNPSTILTYLNNWYTKVLSKQNGFNEKKLADTIWCNDKKVITKSLYNPWNYKTASNLGYNMETTYYNTTVRLVEKNGEAGGTGPSLICENDSAGGKLSKFTVSDTTYGNGALSGYAKVGLLTADEIAFAGGAYEIANNTYYLNKNSLNFWWLLSPADYSGTYSEIWGVNDEGGLTLITSEECRAIRPVLSLVSNISFSSGTGTATDPYIIK